MEKQEILDILNSFSTSYLGGYNGIPESDFDELAELLTDEKLDHTITNNQKPRA